jgi:hypothetical protein
MVKQVKDFANAWKQVAMIDRYPKVSLLCHPTLHEVTYK